MARKKRTDEEAAAAAAAAAAASAGGGQQTAAAGPSSKGGVGSAGGSIKGGAGQGQGRQTRKGGEGPSHAGGIMAAAGGAPREGPLLNGERSSLHSGAGGPQGSRGPLEGPPPGSQHGGGSGAAAATSAEEQSSPERRALNITGLTSTQKKNLKRKLRKQEQKQQEAELHSALQVGAGAASLAARLNQLTQKWNKRLSELESSSRGVSVKHISEAAEQLKKEMQATLDEETSRAKLPINKRASVQQMQEKVKEAELTIHKQQKELQRITAQNNKADAAGGSPDSKSNEQWTAQSQFDESRRYLAHLKEQLVLTQQQSDLRAFQQQTAEIRAALDALVKQAQKAAAQQANSGPEGGRRSQQREEMWHKRLHDLGAALPAGFGGGGPPPFTTVAVQLPGESAVILLTAQGQPSLMLRKVERKFSVLLEKKAAPSGGALDRPVLLTVVGYSQDACERCAAFLHACNFPQVPLGFATAPNCVSLEGQNIGAFIGSSGANLRKLEAELDVLLWLEHTWVTVLGHPEAVKKALPHVKQARSPPSGGEAGGPQQRCELKAEVVRALTQGSPATRERLQAIEKAGGVVVLARPPRRGVPAKTATVLVRGPEPEACKNACAELEEAFGSFDCQVVECDRLKANRLLRGEAVDLSKIQNHELISLLRCDEGLLVVGPREAVPLAVEALQAVMHQLTRVSEALEIKATQLRILDRSKRGEIETLSGATCRAPVYQGENAVLAFTGHPDAVHKALALAQQILEEQKEEELEVSVAAALLFLVEKAHRALEEKHDIRIRVDVPRERLTLRGSGGREAVAEAIRKMEEEVVTSGKVAVKLDVPREAVPMILGRQGANMRRIQSDCNLDNMVIDGRPQAVYFVGSQQAVDQASAAVQEIVANSGAGNAQQHETGGGEDMPERRPRSAGRVGPRGGRAAEVGGGRRGGGGPGTRGRGGAARAPTPVKPYNANVNDESAFPSLGVCMARPGGRWQKRSPATEAPNSEVTANAASDEAPEQHDEGVPVEAAS
ncbi:hypothetical protein Efla_003800 [Eimeria flavescens]